MSCPLALINKVACGLTLKTLRLEPKIIYLNKKFVNNYRIPSNRTPGGSIFQRSQSKKIVSINSPKHPYPWLDFFNFGEGGFNRGGGGYIRGNTVI